MSMNQGAKERSAEVVSTLLQEAQHIIRKHMTATDERQGVMPLAAILVDAYYHELEREEHLRATKANDSLNALMTEARAKLDREELRRATKPVSKLEDE